MTFSGHGWSSPVAVCTNSERRRAREPSSAGEKLAHKTCAHHILGRIKTTIDAHGLPPRGRSSEVHLYWPPRGEGWMPRRNADRHIVGTGE